MEGGREEWRDEVVRGRNGGTGVEDGGRERCCGRYRGRGEQGGGSGPREGLVVEGERVAGRLGRGVITNSSG